MRKGQIKEFCDKCGTKRHQLKNGRYICSKCSREYSIKHYHSNKKPLTTKQKEDKKISNLKWKHTVRESGFTNQQITVIKNRYNLLEEDLVFLVKKQDCKCAICNRKLNIARNVEGGKSADLCIDHCHTTNKVRGLLCRDCNLALGMFKDNINSLTNAIKYLEKI